MPAYSFFITFIAVIQRSSIERVAQRRTRRRKPLFITDVASKSLESVRYPRDGRQHRGFIRIHSSEDRFQSYTEMKYARSPAEAAELAINAGTDMDLNQGDNVMDVYTAQNVREGKVAEQTVRDAVRRA